MARRLLVVATAIAALSLLAACSSDDSGTASSDTTGDSSATIADDGRVLALGEEPVLVDLLSLGIRPVASSANVVVDEGFVGVDAFDTEGIEAMVSTEPNLEQLASFDADTVVATEFVVDRLGREMLEGLGGELVVVPDGDAEAQLAFLGEAFDRQVLDLGVVLQPGADDVANAERGRVYLSEEQLGLLDADTMIAMQSEVVEGESEAIDAMAANPLWTGLPAVEADRVLVVDRLGYPGIAGRIRLVEDLVGLLQDGAP